MNKRQWKKLFKLTKGWTTYICEEEYIILYGFLRNGSLYKYLRAEKRGQSTFGILKPSGRKVKPPKGWFCKSEIIFTPVD
jgi:hypothetical protein